MFKTLFAAVLALSFSLPALADTTPVPTKDFDVYVDTPTGFVFVKLPAGWKFVSRLDAAEMARLPDTVLTALLKDDGAPVMLASQGPSPAKP
jgi:hypothetical protein